MKKKDKVQLLADRLHAFEVVDPGLLATQGRQLLKATANELHRRFPDHVFSTWEGSKQKGWRLVEVPIRKAGQNWEHLQEDEERHELRVELDDKRTLRVLIQLGEREDRWICELTGPLGSVILNQRGQGFVSADGLARIGSPKPLRLVLKDRPTARAREGEVELDVPEPETVGALRVPEQAEYVVRFGDGHPDQELGNLAERRFEIDRGIQDMREPVVTVSSPQLVVDGEPLAALPAPVTVETGFRSLAIPGEQVVERRGRIDRVLLRGESLHPKSLRLQFAHDLGSSQSEWRPVTARRDKPEDGKARWYTLDTPVGVPKENRAYGYLAFRYEERELARIEVRPPPLEGRWRHPKAQRAQAVRAPKPIAAGLETVGTGMAFDLEDDGRVRYTNTGQCGALLDYAFRTLLVPPGGPDGAEALLERVGPFDAWVPQTPLMKIKSAEDLGLLADALAEAGVVRLGTADLRGVIAGDIFAPVGLQEIPASRGVFHLPLPDVGASKQALVWHRGVLLKARLIRLDDGGAPQVELRVGPREVCARTWCDLGPFQPVRAWHHEGGARLQEGEVSAHLRPKSDLAAPWECLEEDLHFEWAGIGFYPDEPDEDDVRFAWRGLIFGGAGQALRFHGWLVTEQLSTRSGAGPFESWGLVLGAPGADPSQPDWISVGRDDLEDLPAEVSETVLRYLDGELRDRYIPVPVDNDALWEVRPVRTRPGAPVERCKVKRAGPSISGPAPADPSVRIWVAP